METVEPRETPQRAGDGGNPVPVRMVLKITPEFQSEPPCGAVDTDGFPVIGSAYVGTQKLGGTAMPCNSGTRPGFGMGAFFLEKRRIIDEKEHD